VVDKRVDRNKFVFAMILDECIAHPLSLGYVITYKVTGSEITHLQAETEFWEGEAP